MSIPKSDVGPTVKLIKAGLHPAARAAGTINGSAVDVRGFESCVLSLQTGAVSGAPSDQSIQALLQHSDDGVTNWFDFTPPTPNVEPPVEALVGPVIAANSEAHLNVHLGGANFVRIQLTTSFTGGTAPTIESAVAIALLGPNSAPVTY